MSEKSSGKKSKKFRRLWSVIFLAVIVIVIIAVVVTGLFVFFKNRSFSQYSVISSVDIGSSSDSVSLQEYGDGYVLCAGDALTYFSEDKIIWSESLEITQPIMDICGSYIAVGDMEGTDVYIYDTSGLAGHISTDYSLLDIEVSNSGVVAMASSSGSSNYIELMDLEGNELVTAKSVFSSSGYLIDIALSDNAAKLAAAFIYTADGSLESRILFYDFSGDTDDEDVLVGGFNQYTDSFITNVIYMDGDIVCAVGDNALTFYDFSETPQIITESLDLEWEILSLSYTDEYILINANAESGAADYTAYVYDTSGIAAAQISLDTSYSNAVMSGNFVLLYSSSTCSMYSLDGRLRFTYTFEDTIDCLLSAGRINKLLYVSAGSAQFIKLK